MVSFMFWLLYHSGKSPHSPLNRRMGRSQSWSGHCAEEKNQLPLPGIQPWFLGHPAQSLFWLSCPSILINTYQTRYRLWAAVQFEIHLRSQDYFLGYDTVSLSEWFDTCVTSQMFPPKQCHENLKSYLFIISLKTTCNINVNLPLTQMLKNTPVCIVLTSLTASKSLWFLCLLVIADGEFVNFWMLWLIVLYTDSIISHICSSFRFSLT